LSFAQNIFLNGCVGRKIVRTSGLNNKLKIWYRLFLIAIMFIHWVLIRNIQYVNLVFFECVLTCSKFMMRKVLYIETTHGSK